MALRKLKVSLSCRKGAMFFICLVAICAVFASTKAVAAEPGRKEIIAKAKKEGHVVWYTTMSMGSSDPMRRKFQKKFPFIKVDLIRLSDQKLLNRILAESRGRGHFVDVMQLQALSLELLVRKYDLVAKYVSPESKFYPEGSKDPEGYWVNIYNNAKGIGYNTRMVSANDAPKEWEDLLDPMWKEKLLMDTGDFEWYGNLLKAWGREKGLAFMKKLSAQKPHFRTGHTLEAMLVASGEYPVAVVLNVDRVEQMRLEGAPLKWVGADPVVVRTHPIAIAKNSRHPNASKLFIDYVLSIEGQELLLETNRIPARPGIKSFVSDALKGVKLYYADPGLADQYEDIIKEYNEIFLKQ